MSWKPLVERCESLPLVLAGPILRKVTPGSVTVWIALKEPRNVTLRVYDTDEKGTLTQRFDGSHHTVRLGDNLYIVAVTASAKIGQTLLAWGERYYYDLFFEMEQADNRHVPISAELPASIETGNRTGTIAHLSTAGILSADSHNTDPLSSLTYSGEPLPGFVLPQDNLNHLRIVHGSCRKPHSDGYDMLAVLDDLVERSGQSNVERPQQIFLTGDQIYADDVATPLLHMLIDASRFLFRGNQEEILPLLDIPAHTLPPGSRHEATHGKAQLTTSTPNNQLLALAEYAAMYLFCWSDVLWPAELPDFAQVCPTMLEISQESKEQERMRAQIASQLTNLRRFASTLPQVRRALANVATYCICDDHEITDDWFLDGAWCRQVLANPLGRRVVRNGLLAYALFQAWGNTPEQFADERGQRFLQALAEWRGEADDCVQTIEQLIGMPAPFDGSGELQRSSQSFHWHYTYQGAQYQVIVMDTRTQRRYLSPYEFPGLLSPCAMQTQIMEPARTDAEATIIISATPVLGIDFIEAIQFWSRWRVRDNYAYDREAWALEWGTFQHFLKTVSALKRIVFLSGDVHYAFGSSMQYWDNRSGKTARIVDFTSSPLCNEGSGSHIAVLAIGYPRLLHLLRHQQTPTLDFFAWDIHDSNHHIVDYMLTIIRRHMYRFWWSIPRLIAARRSPFEIILPARGWLKGTFDAFPPDRTYRLRYLRNTLMPQIIRKRSSLRSLVQRSLLRVGRLALEGLTLLQVGIGRTRDKLLRRTRAVERHVPTFASPAASLTSRAIRRTEVIEGRVEKRRRRLVEIISNYGIWLNKRKAGNLIIGYNNIAEISFDWLPNKKDVSQRLWWYYPLDDDRGPVLKDTIYSDTLELPSSHMEPPLP